MTWSGGAHNYAMFAFLLGLGFFFWVGADLGPAGSVLAVVSLLLGLMFCWVHVDVSEVRTEIALGPWHWPTKVVHLADVAQASSETVQPLRYGGWGYRHCGAGCRAIVVRRGEALNLKMHDDKLFLVTVDGAQEAADLINQSRGQASSEMPNA